MKRRSRRPSPERLVLHESRDGNPATITGGFSPDGKRVALGLQGGRSKEPLLRVWDAIGGREIAEIEGAHANADRVIFSPDGQTLVTGGLASSVLKLWDVASGREITFDRGHEDACTSVAWSPDGRLVASASRDATVRLWDPATGESRATFRQPDPPQWFRDGATAVLFEPSGARLLVGRVDGSVLVESLRRARSCARSSMTGSMARGASPARPTATSRASERRARAKARDTRQGDCLSRSRRRPGSLAEPALGGNPGDARGGLVCRALCKRLLVGAFGAAILVVPRAPARADELRLAGGEILRGKVTKRSLDSVELVSAEGRKRTIATREIKAWLTEADLAEARFEEARELAGTHASEVELQRALALLDRARANASSADDPHAVAGLEHSIAALETDCRARLASYEARIAAERSAAKAERVQDAANATPQNAVRGEPVSAAVALVYLVLSVLGLFFYFLPTVVAVRRNNLTCLVFIVNLIFGVSIVGWFAALLMALSSREQLPRKRRGAGRGGAE